MKTYLGDGCYVDFDGYDLILTAEDGVNVNHRIVLEPYVYRALVEYVDRIRSGAVFHATREE